MPCVDTISRRSVNGLRHLAALLLAAGISQTAPSTALCQAPDTTELARLRVEYETLKLKKDIADLELSKLRAFLPVDALKAPEGTYTSDDSVSVEMHSVAFAELEQTASLIAARIDSAAAGGIVLLWSPTIAADKLAYDAMALRTEYYLSRAEDLLLGLPTGVPTGGHISPPLSPLLAIEVIKGVGATLGLLRSDVAIHGRTLSMSDELLATMIAARVTGVQVVSPALVIPAVPSIRDKKTIESRLLGGVSDLVNVRSKLAAKAADVTEKLAAAKQETDRVKAKTRLDGIQWISAEIDSFLGSLTVPGALDGISPLAKALRTEELLGLRRAADKDRFFLDAHVIRASGSSKGSRNALSGAKVAFAGQVTAVYTLSDAQGTIVASDALVRTSKYRRAKDIVPDE